MMSRLDASPWSIGSIGHGASGCQHIGDRVSRQAHIRGQFQEIFTLADVDRFGEERATQVAGELHHGLSGFGKAYGFQYQMCGRGRCGAYRFPDFRVDLSIVIFRRGVADVVGEPFVPTAIYPPVADFVGGVAKDVYALMAQLNLVAPVFLQFIDPSLRDPGPDATEIPC